MAKIRKLILLSTFWLDFFFTMISELTGVALEIFAILHITMSPIIGLSCLYLFFALLFSSYWYFAVVYMAWWYYDRETPYRAGRLSSLVRNWFIWRYFARYFPIRLHKTADLDPSKNYIFAIHPHGVAVFGGFINFGTNATGFDNKFPGLSVHVCSVNAQFTGPFYRDYIISLGVGSANADTIDFQLTEMGPGHSVLIAIGGAAEVHLSDPQSYTLKLKNRKGFIRRALKTGASVVPVFSFNEHRLYDIPPVEKGTWIDYYFKFMRSFTHNILPLHAHGRWWLLVPKRLPVDTVVGAPINFNEMKAFEKGRDPPEELVDECHKIYLEGLSKLYDDHKANFGDQHTPLVFV